MPISNLATPDDWERLKRPKSRKRSKYGVLQDRKGKLDRTYRGHLYDSKLECDYAIQLDLELATGAIRSWRRQVIVMLQEGDRAHRIEWRADFLVEFPDRTREYRECKGRILPVWRIKEKLYHGTDSPQTSLPLIIVTRPKGQKHFTLTVSTP